VNLKLSNRIEYARDELNKEIERQDYYLLAPSILRLSVKLDKLITRYNKHIVKRKRF